MFIKFTREGIWWLANKLNTGQLQQYSFVWPMVLQWLSDQVKQRKEEKS